MNKRFFKKFTLVIALLLLMFIGNIFYSTGYFRQVKNHFNGEILHKISLPGVEDITISQRDSFAILSSTDRKIFPAGDFENGGLYLLDLKDKKFNIRSLTINFKEDFAPHGISIFEKEKGHIIAAINHKPEGHSIELFSLDDNVLDHLKTLRHESMISPNDIVLLNEEEFYFTNDHRYTRGIGRYIEDYAGFALSDIIYFNGKTFTKAAGGISYANGINYDKERELLYVASPRKFEIKVYATKENRSLQFIENISCQTGVDNIEFDKNGSLWVGAHPNLLRFAAYAKGKKEYSPSEIIRIDYRSKGEYSLEKVFVDQGQAMSGSSVAAPFGDLILAGNVMDSHFLILKTK